MNKVNVLKDRCRVKKRRSNGSLLLLFLVLFFLTSYLVISVSKIMTTENPGYVSLTVW